LPPGCTGCSLCCDRSRSPDVGEFDLLTPRVKGECVEEGHISTVDFVQPSLPGVGGFALPLRDKAAITETRDRNQPGTAAERTPPNLTPSRQ
jgi:hypothetical protein